MPQVEMLILIDSNTSFHFLLRFPLVSTEKKKKGLKVPQNMTLFVWMNNDLHKTIQNSSRFKDSK